MNKKKNLMFRNVLCSTLAVAFLPFYGLGYVVYLLSKLTRSLGMLLMLNTCSARNELVGFFSVWRSIGDLLKN